MNIRERYFEWLYDHIDMVGNVSYRKLLEFMYDKEFEWVLDRDENRAHDGIDLRYRFQEETGSSAKELKGPCSIFEMILALAIRCEENIMDDTNYGNRTHQWFWKMLTNLGLGDMDDNRFDIDRANDILERFLDRAYEPDGRGGLFYLKDCNEDLRDVEIWYQLMWYLNSIT